MYFNKDNNFFHGIMFHHFHDNNVHSKGQGSIDKDEFYNLVKFIGRVNILDADIFLEKFIKNTIKENEVCLTFDDGIKCQIDIALPVLDDLKIKSFFFVYSSMFENNPDHLEIYRYFRTNYFHNIDEFYIEFYKYVESDLNKFFIENEDKIKLTKQKFPFYSFEDIKFRLVRDNFLKKNEYENIMNLIMKNNKFNPKDVFSKLFFDKKDLVNLYNNDHIIGLHSHSHPTLLEKLSYEDQEKEYQKNLQVLASILDQPKNKFLSMSHPNGSYNDDTLNILKKIGIKIGFKQIMKLEKEKKMQSINNSFLEIAREDHSNILKEINL